ncbi:MAG: TonB-dependent receptor, partial [Oricola sp.]|nr:TonB-dependent receptor [Oricola sp.]
NVFAHYDLNDKMTGYMELHYSNNVTEMQIAPTNIGGSLLVDVDNPYVSDEVRDIFALLDARETGPTTVTQGLASITTTPNDGIAVINYNRRFSDLPARNAKGDHSVFRTAIGVRGDLGDLSDSMFREMSYDVYYTYARTSESQLQIGSVSRSAILRNMLSEGGADPVLNLFGQNISDAAAEAILISANSKIEAEQQVAAATITGVAFDMPAGPVDFALGGEWRRSEASYVPDRFLSSGDVSGWNSAAATAGSTSVAEIFSEVRVPILADMPAFERLNLNGAFRYSNYDLDGVGGVWTYSAGAEWAPTTDLTFRGQFQHAIRAPNVGELFGGRGSDGPVAQDPCSSMQPVDQRTQAVRDICIATGVPAGAVFDVSVQPSPFIQQIRGGNPNLDTEKSDTKTFGLVYQPEFINGLAISVDYFSIDLEDAIATLGGGGVQNVLNLCYNILQDASSVYCQAVNRDPLTGAISEPDFVMTTFANIGGIKTSGVDFEAQYRFQTSWGLLGESDWMFGTNWTYTDEFTITPIQELPDINNECVGAWGGTCGQPIPELKGTARITWMTGPATLSLAARYLGEVTTDRIIVPERNGESHPDFEDISNPKIARTVYLDLAAGYDLAEGTRFTFGIRNLLDKDPEIGAPVQTYDATGRKFFLSVNTRF